MTARRLHQVTLLTLPLLIAVALFAGRGALRAQEAESVVGLSGTLQGVSGEPYAHELSAEDGQTYALLGESPDVEDRLTQLAAEGATVSISGTLQRQSPISTLPLIVVSAVELVAPEPLVPTATPPSLTRQTPTPGGVPTVVPVETIEMPGMLPTLSIEETPLLVPTATPPGLPPEVVSTAPVTLPTTVNVYAVYLREGPGSDFTTAGSVESGTRCIASGRTVDSTWLSVECPAGSGWIRQSLLAAEGNVAALPVVIASPPDVAASETPRPTPSPITWRALGYPNRTLSGDPSVGFNTPVIDFDWGRGAPVEGMPVDNFSVRFDAEIPFAPGDYLFTVAYDDGVRLIVDGQVVLSDWTDGPLRSSAWRGRLAGTVPVRLEFFEAFYDARVRMEIARIATQPIPTPGLMPTPVPTRGGAPLMLPQDEWIAGYFTNANVEGIPALVRNESADDMLDPVLPPLITARTPLARDFGLSSPAPTILGLDGWSARWQGLFSFVEGPHRFDATGNGGVAVYVDGIRIIGGELGSAGASASWSVSLAPGIHEVTIEFFDVEGPAAVRISWQALDGTGAGDMQPLPTATTIPSVAAPVHVPTATMPSPAVPPVEPATPVPVPGDHPTSTPFPIGK